MQLFYIKLLIFNKKLKNFQNLYKNFAERVRGWWKCSGSVEQKVAWKATKFVQNFAWKRTFNFEKSPRVSECVFLHTGVEIVEPRPTRSHNGFCRIVLLGFNSVFTVLVGKVKIIIFYKTANNFLLLFILFLYFWPSFYIVKIKKYHIIKKENVKPI